MIELIPAIDIYQGACVRLRQGKFEEITKYTDNPIEIAEEFDRSGIKRLHLVDLEGAQSGTPKNLAILKEIKRATNLKIDFGGGLRTLKQIKQALSGGADYISIGSLAVEKPQLMEEWMQQIGYDRFILAADSQNELVPVRGWRYSSSISVYELIAQYQDRGVTRIMCTDISRDGMMQGVNTNFYRKLRKQFPRLHLIASGGTRSESDIQKLSAIGMDGVILGKAIYEEKINLKHLVNATNF